MLAPLRAGTRPEMSFATPIRSAADAGHLGDSGVRTWVGVANDISGRVPARSGASIPHQQFTVPISETTGDPQIAAIETCLSTFAFEVGLSEHGVAGVGREDVDTIAFRQAAGETGYWIGGAQGGGFAHVLRPVLPVAQVNQNVYLALLGDALCTGVDVDADWIARTSIVEAARPTALVLRLRPDTTCACSLVITVQEPFARKL